MLSILGFMMIIVFMYLIMSNRVSALTALILVPIVFALIGGFAGGLGDMMLKGISDIAPTGIMLLFAILYFGIMIDAGLFDPIIKQILTFVKGDPLKIVVGTALLTMMISLDGDGTTTYMITIAAMLPLYKRLGMNPLILAGVAMLGSGVMNIIPWGGPTARVLTSLKLDTSEVFTPLIPAMILGLLWVIFVAYVLGKRERKRLGVVDIEYQSSVKTTSETSAASEAPSFKRPSLLWFNFLLTVVLMVALVTNLLPLPILFMTAFAIALMVNYPKLKEQQDRISAHAGNALSVISMVFAAGIFTGILSGTKMVDAMANSLVSLIPDSMGPHLPIITAITSMPFTFFMSNDAYYFGVLPIIAEAASNYGIDAAEIGRASLLGQPVHLLSPLVPSTYLLVGMVGVTFGDHQKFTLKWAIGTTIVMTIAAVILGIISF
ncbi:citrate transporter [Bacillus glycinifermentans]|uniref:Citrate transporter n=1 Tax=Bacillus glycinifermentans TaxID=1664069 RepID=A0A0J6EPP8_9BACI|nr:citrate transporter CitH [Bacillus glycinifermentans]ATH93787.1 citrate transporter [Bacillus glycinifermentans]KMM59543.1 citrate transporter [Bacillus glycinifermentans]KRT90035.1 citrate transporter [Bacillus glycinifermentans]MEC0483714.1 citrate transporter CitH [Bacillus glycinifermentans]MEC0496209.1 citrate transporter CitH [Bacillus glycinifermentans]